MIVTDVQKLTEYGFMRDPSILQEYLVLVLSVEQTGGIKWTIYRKLHSFWMLSDQLPFAPYCPRYEYDRTVESIEAIRNELTNWLSQLVQIPSVLGSAMFQDFISVEANVKPPGLRLELFTPHSEEMNMDDMFGNMTDDGNFEMDDKENSVRLIQNETVVYQNQSVKSAKCKLEDFILLKVIGKGSFGKVIQVRKKDTGEIYAMKVLRKENIIKRNQVEHTRTERHVLGYVQHPFVVGLNFAFQTEDKLYFILDYCAGGELFFHLGKVNRLGEPRARFYIAQIVLALEYMHSLDIIYRDLKPENVLLDDAGHIKLTDFGLSKEGIQGNFSGAHSFCGTPEYLAPEILNRSGHGRAVDWWSLGALLYEMLTGLPPFYCRDRERLFDKIRNGQLNYPKYLSPMAKSLLCGLLERDPTKRLGTSENDATDIKSHPFFQSIDWDKLYDGEIEPPWKPTISDCLDTSQFDSEFTSMPIVSPDTRPSYGGLPMRQKIPLSTSMHRKRADFESLFQGFTYTEESKFAEGKFASSPQL